MSVGCCCRVLGSGAGSLGWDWVVLSGVGWWCCVPGLGLGGAGCCWVVVLGPWVGIGWSGAVRRVGAGASRWEWVVRVGVVELSMVHVVGVGVLHRIRISELTSGVIIT